MDGNAEFFREEPQLQQDLPFLDLGKDKHQGGNDRKDKPIGNFLNRPSFISIYSIQTHDLIIVL